MQNESAVQFETNRRIHMGLAVKNLERSAAFYRVLLGHEPTKTRAHYAKFEVADPPVNLSLNEVGGETGPNNVVTHFGIQVKSSGAVQEAAERLRAAGQDTSVEDHVTCCHAVQTKVWAADPDGNRWEVFVVLDNDATKPHNSNGCCPDIPVIMGAIERGDLAAATAAFQQAGGHAACSCLATPERGRVTREVLK